MTYNPINFNNGQAGGTPLSASNLRHVENGIVAAHNDIAALTANVNSLSERYGTPLVAHTAAEMTDTTKIYVYVGSETGYTTGDWYYYDGDSWESGGAYNSTAVNTDTTLTQEDMAADAKKVGDEISDLRSTIEQIEGDIGGMSAQAKTALLNCLSAVIFDSDQSDELIQALREALYSNYVGVTGLTLNYDTLALEVGDTVKLVANVRPNNASDKSVTWATSNSNILTVDSLGNVSAVSEGMATITATTTDGGYIATCSVEVQEEVIVYTITNNLTNCNNSNTSTTINENSSYSGTITIADSYLLSSATVTMGGVDITSTAYNNGLISIPSVTGDIVITVVAEAVGNIFEGLTINKNKYIKTSDGTLQNSTSEFATDMADVSRYAGEYIMVHYNGASNDSGQPAQGSYRTVFYDSNETFLSYFNHTKVNYSILIPSNAAYMRIGGHYAGLTSVSVNLAEDGIGTLVNGSYYSPDNGSVVADNGYARSDDLRPISDGVYAVVKVFSLICYNSSKNFVRAIRQPSSTVIINSTDSYGGITATAANAATAKAYINDGIEIGEVIYNG